MHYAPLFAAAIGLVSSTVFAQDAPDSSSSARAAPPTVRLGVFGDAGGGWTQRSADSSGDLGAWTGGEAALVFNGLHGIRFGGQAYTLGTLVNASVTTFDLDYSLQLNTAPRLGGVSGSFGFLLGPSLAFVVCRDAPSNDQTLFGVRFGIFADLNLGNFMVGLDASLRAAVPVAGLDATDWMATAGIHAGFAFELPLSSRHATAVARADRGGRGSDP